MYKLWQDFLVTTSPGERDAVTSPPKNLHQSAAASIDQFVQVDERLAETSSVVAGTDFDQPRRWSSRQDRPPGRFLERFEVLAVENDSHDAADPGRDL